MIEDIWSGKNKLFWFLVPFSIIFKSIVAIRQRLYKYKILKSWQSPVPVIIVGNLSVGGNGKTPLVIYLIQNLRQKGYKVGVVSRGYGGKSKNYPLIVNETTPASMVGDEPALVFQKTKVPFAVSPKRSKAVQLLLKEYSLDIIISDDGLQHYALNRDIEIAVIDGDKKFGNAYLLPAGPMREPISRLNNVDFAVMNGKDKWDGLIEYNLTSYNMQLEPQLAVNLLTEEHKALHELKSVVAMAGIGNPQRFFTTLKNNKIEPIKKIAFSDHQNYTKEMLASKVTSDQTLLMTEKDAVKCLNFAEDNWWYLPVYAKINQAFLDELIKKLNQIPRNNNDKTKFA